MQGAFGFSGRLGRLPYAILTLGLSASVLVLANPSEAHFVQLFTAPWTVLGRALDGLIRLEGNRVPMADAIVFFPIFSLLTWTVSVMTIRRVRDLGQSPWWTVLIFFSGSVLPAMLVLSCLPSAKPPERTWSGRLNPSVHPAD